jgi:multidrug efflux pump subunit AcrA (membrane-fusion protein)
MKRLLLPLVLLAPALPPAPAGPGHAHDATPASASPTQGPVRLTQTMVRNLDLQTAEATLRPLEHTFPALGTVEAVPGQVTAVTSRVAGRVLQVAVREGQRVRAGDLLLEVESRVVADPPPRIAFRAPRDGVILESQILPGGAVEPDRTLLLVADLSTVELVAQVPEARLAAVRPGQAVRIRPVAYPEEIVAGTVQSTAARLSREQGTLRVFVRAANPDGRLLAGMRAHLAFVVGQTETAVVVPRAAVLGENGDLFVFRQLPTAPFAYERTPVVLGWREEPWVELVDGILPGDRVVTRGNYQLQYVGGGAARIEDDHGHSHGPGGHQH